MEGDDDLDTDMLLLLLLLLLLLVLLLLLLPRGCWPYCCARDLICVSATALAVLIVMGRGLTDEAVLDTAAPTCDIDDTCEDRTFGPYDWSKRNCFFETRGCDFDTTL